MLIDVKKWLHAHDFCGESRTIKRLDEAGPLKDDPALFTDQRVLNWCDGCDASNALLWITGSKGSGKSILVSAISARLSRQSPDKICSFSFSRRIRDSSVELPREALRFLAFDRAIQNPVVLERLADLAQSEVNLAGAGVQEIWNTVFVNEIFRLEPKLFLFVNGFERLKQSHQLDQDKFLPLLASLPSLRPTIRVIINGNYDPDTKRELESTFAVTINLDHEIEYTHALTRRIIDFQLPPRLKTEVSPYLKILHDVARTSTNRLTDVKMLLKAVAISDPLDIPSAVSTLREFRELGLIPLNRRVEDILLSRVSENTAWAYTLFRRSAALALDRGNVPSTFSSSYQYVAHFYDQPIPIIIRTATMSRRCTIQWARLLNRSTFDSKIAQQLFSWLQGFCLRGITPWDLNSEEFKFVRCIWKFTQPLRNGFVLLKRSKSNIVRHWGLLISELSRDELATIYRNIESSREADPRPLGQIHELRLIKGKVVYKHRDVSRAELIKMKRENAYVYYRGETAYQDPEILALGRPYISAILMCI